MNDDEKNTLPGNPHIDRASLILFDGKRRQRFELSHDSWQYGEAQPPAGSKRLDGIMSDVAEAIWQPRNTMSGVAAPIARDQDARAANEGWAPPQPQAMGELLNANTVRLLAGPVHDPLTHKVYRTGDQMAAQVWERSVGELPQRTASDAPVGYDPIEGIPPHKDDITARMGDSAPGGYASPRKLPTIKIEAYDDEKRRVGSVTIEADGRIFDDLPEVNASEAMHIAVHAVSKALHGVTTRSPSEAHALAGAQHLDEALSGTTEGIVGSVLSDAEAHAGDPLGSKDAEKAPPLFVLDTGHSKAEIYPHGIELHGAYDGHDLMRQAISIMPMILLREKTRQYSEAAKIEYAARVLRDAVTHGDTDECDAAGELIDELARWLSGSPEDQVSGPDAARSWAEGDRKRYDDVFKPLGEAFQADMADTAREVRDEDLTARTAAALSRASQYIHSEEAADSMDEAFAIAVAEGCAWLRVEHTDVGGYVLSAMRKGFDPTADGKPDLVADIEAQRDAINAKGFDHKAGDAYLRGQAKTQTIADGDKAHTHMVYVQQDGASLSLGGPFDAGDCRGVHPSTESLAAIRAVAEQAAQDPKATMAIDPGAAEGDQAVFTIAGKNATAMDEACRHAEAHGRALVQLTYTHAEGYEVQMVDPVHPAESEYIQARTIARRHGAAILEYRDGGGRFVVKSPKSFKIGSMRLFNGGLTFFGEVRSKPKT